jgi:uncharacterized membrane protein
VSIESGRKYGYYGSLLNVIFPIVAVVVAMAFVFFLIGGIEPQVTNSTSLSAFFGFFGGGCILLLIVLGLIGIAAYLMLTYSMYKLSKYYSEPAIFKNVLYAFILNIVSGVIALILVNSV